MKKDTKSILKLIYLYIFSVVGLILIIVGGVGLINLGLKSFVFVDADRDYYAMQPPIPYKVDVEKLSNSSDLTAEEQEAVRSWISEYESWQESVKNQDFRKSQKQRDAAQAIALLIIGIPLYLYHWNMVRKKD